MEMKNKNTTIYLIIGLLVVIFVIWYNQTGEKKSNLERASDDISDGISNASDEFKDKTPIEKVGDAIEDAGEKIKDSID